VYVKLNISLKQLRSFNSYAAKQPLFILNPNREFLKLTAVAFITCDHRDINNSWEVGSVRGNLDMYQETFYSCWKAVTESELAASTLCPPYFSYVLGTYARFFLPHPFSACSSIFSIMIVIWIISRGHYFKYISVTGL